MTSLNSCFFSIYLMTEKSQEFNENMLTFPSHHAIKYIFGSFIFYQIQKTGLKNKVIQLFYTKLKIQRKLSFQIELYIYEILKNIKMIFSKVSKSISLAQFQSSNINQIIDNGLPKIPTYIMQLVIDTTILVILTTQKMVNGKWSTQKSIPQRTP